MRLYPRSDNGLAHSRSSFSNSLYPIRLILFSDARLDITSFKAASIRGLSWGDINSRLFCPQETGKPQRRIFRFPRIDRNPGRCRITDGSLGSTRVNRSTVIAVRLARAIGRSLSS